MDKTDNRVSKIKEELSGNSDFNVRKIEIKAGTVYILFLNTISDNQFITESIIKPIIKKKDEIKDAKEIKDKVITHTDINNVQSLEEVSTYILTGNTVLIFSFSEEIFYCSSRKIPERAVEIPPSETVIKGPREGFTESLTTNLSLIRRRVANEKLKIEELLLGNDTFTKGAFVYIEGTAPASLVEQVKRRVISISQEQKYIQESNYLGELLQDKPSAFDTVGYTEKPDDLVAKIHEGKIAILVDGDPFAITLPYFFIENFHSPSDYSLNRFIANYFRLVRWIGVMISVFFPGIYVALTTYHFHLIPPIFLFRLAVARAGVPFPIYLEVLLMMFFFQILREASLRLPQSIAQAISIVGALILGDTAVQSGLASTIAILLVALTALSAFLAPNIFGAISIWTDILIIFSSLLGLPGFLIGLLLLISHLASLTSCGYPFLYPVGTKDSVQYSDRILRPEIHHLPDSINEDDQK